MFGFGDVRRVLQCSKEVKIFEERRVVDIRITLMKIETEMTEVWDKYK
jgi:hypothetical protein